ncbi:hypothetical protein [Halomarina oriensis]|nr:hypothetical protein [Halomarina oriensis]
MGTNGHDGDAVVEDGDHDGDDGPAFEETAAADSDAVLSCPNCEFRSPVTAVSLRRGDACPDCRAGYLVTERNP